MKYSKMTVAILSFIIGFIFFIGASTCKVKDFNWNMYSNSADCMTKMLDNMEKDGVILDPWNISRVERYCAQYDR